MKKMKIIIFLISISLCYSQNKEPDPETFDFPFTSQTATRGALSAHTQDKFVAGWWWGFDIVCADNLTSNMSATYFGANNNYWVFEIQNLINTLSHPNYNLHGTAGKIKLTPASWILPFNGVSMQYEPTLLINAPYDFQKVATDESANSIFGFKNRVGGTIERDAYNPSDVKYRLKLSSADRNKTILSEPWMNDQIRRLDSKLIMNDVFENNNDKPHNYNDAYYTSLMQSGRAWFVSINFRITSVMTGNSSDIIMKIKLPYKDGKGNPGFIKFSTLPPKLNPDYTDENNPTLTNEFQYFVNSSNVNGRGGFYYYAPSSPTYEFIITKGLLRSFYVTQNQDITISAYFERDIKGKINPLPIWEHFDGNGGKDDPNGEDFHTLGLDVYYEGDWDIAIDWLRIGNPYSLAVYQGRFDIDWWFDYQRLIDFVHDKPGNCIKKEKDNNGHGIEESGADFDISNFKKSVNIGDNYELFRLYSGNGHDATCIWNWGMKRYINKLYPGMFVQSMGSEYSDEYQWYCQPNDRWQSLPALKGGYASPAYYPAGTAPAYGLGDKSGIKGPPAYMSGSNIINNFTLNSGYETWLKYPYLNTSFQAYGGSSFDYDNPCQGCNIIQMIREEKDITNYNHVDGTQTTIPSEAFYDAIFGGGGDLAQTNCFQGRWENGCYMGIYPSLFKNGADKFMYNGHNWWAQVFITPSWLAPMTGNSFKSGFFRPFTGEEVSLMCYTGIILGAKGLVYDRIGGEAFVLIPDKDTKKDDVQGLFVGPNFSNNETNTNDAVPNNSELYFCKPKQGFEADNDLNQKIGFDYLKKDELGVDFLSVSNDLSHLLDLMEPNNTLPPNKLARIHNFAQFLGVPDDRIYLGAKSTRLALRKVHDFAMENSSTLLNLRLVSWFAKGFRTWTSHHPNVPITKIKDFIKVPDKMDNLEANIPLKVRPIGREKDGKPHFEPPDSTFYDITLLAETGTEADLNGTKDIKSMDKVFYIGVLNRRTDPLIIKDGCTDPDNSPDGCVEFYSNAEFDKGVISDGYDISGTNQPASWWQARWWKRLGCREITIPLNVNSANPNDYKLVKVTELSRNDYKEFKDPSGNYLITSAELSKLFPKISTIVGQDGTFTAKFLPGEGKIFKCEVINRPISLSGSLAHSNQSKLVAYPLANGDLVLS